MPFYCQCFAGGLSEHSKNDSEVLFIPGTSNGFTAPLPAVKKTRVHRAGPTPRSTNSAVYTRVWAAQEENSSGCKSSDYLKAWNELSQEEKEHYESLAIKYIALLMMSSWWSKSLYRT